MGGLCGFLAGSAVALIAGVFGALDGVLVDHHSAFYVLCLSATVIGGVPCAVLGYLFPKTFRWILEVVSQLHF